MFKIKLEAGQKHDFVNPVLKVSKKVLTKKTKKCRDDKSKKEQDGNSKTELVSLH